MLAAAQPANDCARYRDDDLQPCEFRRYEQADVLDDGDARRLQDAAALALKAIDARDKKELFSKLEDVDKACESCHLHYWYPNDKRAREAANEDGVN